jgi:hypothetical protein
MRSIAASAFVVSALVLATSATVSSNAASGIYCPARSAAWVFSVSDLEADVQVGITYNSYQLQLRNILRLYHRSSSRQESASCLHNVTVPAESAMNHYSTAYRVWSWCISHLGCDANHEAQRQRQWSAARAAIERATNNLD